MQGAAPYVELHNPLCDRFQKFFLGLYNNNKQGGSAKVQYPAVGLFARATFTLLL